MTYADPGSDSDYSMVARTNLRTEELAAGATTREFLPYHLDSAATSSSSPYQKDFELTPIKA